MQASIGQQLQNDRIAIERCTWSGPKQLAKTYNKGFPNHSTLINYGQEPMGSCYGVIRINYLSLTFDLRVWKPGLLIVFATSFILSFHVLISYSLWYDY